MALSTKTTETARCRCSLLPGWNHRRAHSGGLQNGDDVPEYDPVQPDATATVWPGLHARTQLASGACVVSQHGEGGSRDLHIGICAASDRAESKRAAGKDNRNSPWHQSHFSRESSAASLVVGGGVHFVRVHP